MQYIADRSRNISSASVLKSTIIVLFEQQKRTVQRRRFIFKEHEQLLNSNLKLLDKPSFPMKSFHRTRKYFKTIKRNVHDPRRLIDIYGQLLNLKNWKTSGLQCVPSTTIKKPMITEHVHHVRQTEYLPGTFCCMSAVKQAFILGNMRTLLGSLEG